MEYGLIKDLDASALDYSMLEQDDLINIVLQRSEVLTDVARPGELIREWMAGDSSRFKDLVRTKGSVFAQRALRVIQTEFEVLRPTLDQIGPTKIADIGCGYAFFDLLAYHRYGSDLFLIDIEENERRHFGFDEEGAAYTNLSTAKAFLTANGVPADQVTTWNPERDDVEEGKKPDLAVSFLSCGFHYPVDMYLPFFRFGVAPGGAILLDLRNQSFAENRRKLEKLGQVKVLSKGRGRRRVLVRKGRR